MTVPEHAVSVVVRRAERADLLEVLRIERDAFPQPWPYPAFDRFLGEPGFLVADAGAGPRSAAVSGADARRDRGDARSGGDRDASDDGVPEVVGYVVADCTPGDGPTLGHVKDLAVRADRRGEGIGATLLARALAVLDEQSADTVKLEVRRSNDPARELYDSFGFEHLRTVPGYYDDGEDALVLVCES